MTTLNFAYQNGANNGIGSDTFTVKADTANTTQTDIIKTFTVKASDGGSKTLTFILLGIKDTTFSLSVNKDSNVWGLIKFDTDMKTLGTEENPYSIRFGKTLTSKTMYVFSNTNNVSEPWTIEVYKTAKNGSIVSLSDFNNLMSISTLAGNNKDSITVSCKSNISTDTYVIVYKFIQTNTGRIFYLLVKLEPYVTFDNFNTLLLSYKYASGADLDTATFVNLPSISSYWGYKGNAATNKTYGKFILFSGDDISLNSGEESILINMKELVETAIENGDINNNTTSFTIDVYANWYGSARNDKGKYVGDHDGNDSPRVLKGTITDMTVRTYSGDTFTTKNSDNALLEWIPSGSNKQLESKSVYSSGINILAADNLNHLNVKKYYTKVFTFEYDIASDSTAVIPCTDDSGVDSDFWAQIDTYNNTWVWNDDPQSRRFSVFILKQYDTTDIIPLTVHSSIYVKGHGYLPKNFYIEKAFKSSEDDCWYVYDTNKNLIGDNSKGTLQINVTSETTQLYIKLYTPQVNDYTMFYISNLKLHQNDSPEQFDFGIGIKGTEQTKYDIYSRDVVMPNTLTPNKVTGYSYKQVGTAAKTPEDFWFSKSNDTLCKFYIDSDCTREVLTDSKITPGNDTNFTIYTKPTNINTTPYCMFGDNNEIKNAGDSTIIDVVLLGTVMIDQGKGLKGIVSVKDGGNYTAYTNNLVLWYSVSTTGGVVTFTVKSATLNGTSFTPTLKLESDLTYNSSWIVSCSGNTATVTVPLNTEGVYRQYIALGLYNGSTHIATFPIGVSLDSK